jgi:CCR4-NOT transcription complex subunit 6
LSQLHFPIQTRIETVNELASVPTLHPHRFQLVNEYLVEFNRLAMANSAGSSDMLNRVMLRDNIGLVALFEVKQSLPTSDPNRPQYLLVANAHIHWDPEYRDVKLIQMVMFMSELEAIVSKAQQELNVMHQSPIPNSPGIPLLLCGDFNSLPESSVIEYLTKARMSTLHKDLQDFSYDGYTSRVSSINNHNKPEIAHRFPIRSAYQEHHIAYSNYTYSFKGIIDYIFYSFDFLRLQGLLGPIDKDWFQQWRVIGCPNPHYPSDHFPLLCQFELAPQK